MSLKTIGLTSTSRRWLRKVSSKAIPDGEFKGDRMMTRYEFAAIVYRIVESGVGSTDPELSKLVKEFSPELQYIRIDTIQKDRNGKPTIERVRVISDAK